MRSFASHALWLGTVGIIVTNTAGLSPALAMESCNGQYSAALLQPLPTPTIVALDMHDNSPTNITLGKAFMSGIQAAGKTITGPPSAKISVTYQIVGQGEDGGATGGGLDRGGGAGTGWSTWSGGSAASMRGGQTMALPDFPRYDMFTPKPTVQAAVLMLRAEVHDAQTNALDWVASVQCTMRGSDNEQLAYQLGSLIGNAMGRRIETQPM